MVFQREALFVIPFQNAISAAWSVALVCAAAKVTLQERKMATKKTTVMVRKEGEDVKLGLPFFIFFYFFKFRWISSM